MDDCQDTTVVTVENSVKIEGKFKDIVLDRVILEKSSELFQTVVDKILKTKRLLDMDINLISMSSGISLFNMKCQFSRQKICPPENAMPS